MNPSPRRGRQSCERTPNLSLAPRAQYFFAPYPGLTPRPGSPAEHLGWGGGLYAFTLLRRLLTEPHSIRDSRFTREKHWKIKDELEIPKCTRNTGREWTGKDVRELRELAKENTPTRVSGVKLGRTVESVRSKTGSKSISLKPTNQSPRNRRAA